MPEAIVFIGDRSVGAGSPVYVIAEIGINHNGDLADRAAPSSTSPPSPAATP